MILHKKAIAALLAFGTAAAAFQIVPVSAEAAPDYEARTVTAYLYGKENTEEITCLFRSDLPDVPYISIDDFLNPIYDDDFSVDMKSDSLYTVRNRNGSMMIDTVQDTLYSDRFEDFAFRGVIDPFEPMPYMEYTGMRLVGDAGSMTVDFGAYGIDLTAYNGRAYAPLNILSDMFAFTYAVPSYAKGGVYYISALDKDTIDTTDLLNQMTRTPEMTEYTYRSLCMTMDYFYGRPERVEIAESIQEKGFDRTLDEFSDISRTAKEFLLSESTVDFVIGMIYLDKMLNDGGHTKLLLPAIMDSQNFSASETALALAGIMQDTSSPYSQLITEHFTNAMKEVLKPTAGPSRARDAAYAGYEVIREWKDQGIRLLRYEDTCVFVFNSFMREDAEPFIWSLNYAQDNGCRNFVLDITANAGGHETILLYMMSVISNQDKLKCICTLTGNTMETEARYDRNYDGVFDEQDDAVKYDLKFAIMATKASFSCGNLMPVMAKAAGIPIIGETSGGGSCIVCFMDTANDYPYNLAHIQRWVDSDGNPVDFGVEPDYVLVKYGDSENPDYTELYDLAKVQALITEYYAEKPDVTETVQTDHTDAQTTTKTTASPASAPAESGVNTGDAEPAAAFGILTAAVLLAVSARRRRKI